MAKSDKKKVTWPHSDKVKMTAHRNGQWCKRVDTVLRYFGPISDPDGALDRYWRFVAGESDTTSPSGEPTVADVFNRFLNYRKPHVLADRQQDDRADRAMGPTMFHRYMKSGKIMAGVVGRSRVAATLTPTDFASVKAALEKQYSVGTLVGYINCIRSVFTWAYEQGVLRQPARFVR